MREKIISLLRYYLRPKAVILMYHRVHATDRDIWDICVSPATFEEHLLALKKNFRVLSIGELAAGLRKNKIIRNSVVITFDDGYVDNFLAACPLLEKHQLPATFYISSGNVGQQKEFWWDELEKILLDTPVLPTKLEITVGGQRHFFLLKDEEILTDELRLKHLSWKADEQAPPSARSQVFYALWSNLKPLPPQQQQHLLHQLREWASVPYQCRENFHSISVEQLQKIAANPLFTVGAHTVNHSALTAHPAVFQQEELQLNRAFLEEAIGQPVQHMSYPYGDYQDSTVQMVHGLNFTTACTTRETVIARNSPLLTLGRFQARNIPAKDLVLDVKRWQKEIARW